MPDQQQPADWHRIFTISAAYVAFIIGSGFATGQEALQFFAGHGPMGLLGALVTTLLLVYTCGSMLRAGQRANLANNQEAFTYICGPHLGPVLTWYTMILIIAVATVMIAGAAATLAQAFAIPTVLGAASIALIALVTLILGLKRLLSVLSLIGPIIILLVLGTAVLSLLDGLPTADAIAKGKSHVPYRASQSWWFSALLYVGLILPGMAGFIPIVGSATKGRSEIRAIALIGPLLPMVTLSLVVLAMYSALQEVSYSEVPLMKLAEDISPALGSLFAVAIFLGIYTTITPLLWTVCSRFAVEGSRRYSILVISLCTISYLGGTVLPFGQLLNWIYPTVGYVGLLILACLIYKDVLVKIRSD